MNSQSTTNAIPGTPYYTYFDNEKGDYSIGYKINTEEEMLLAFTDREDAAILICRALNNFNPKAVTQ